MRAGLNVRCLSGVDVFAYSEAMSMRFERLGLCEEVIWSLWCFRGVAGTSRW